MPLTDDMIGEIVERYRREVDRYQKLVDFVTQECQQLIAENAIPATVQSRTKDPDRLRTKLRKYRQGYDSVDAIFGGDGFKDFAGVRVATYVESDRDRVVAEIEKRFVGTGGGDVQAVVKDAPGLDAFYRATHCQVCLPDEDLTAQYENLRGTSCEVQVCSLLAHVWNEIEHDLEYKPTTGELSDQEKQALAALGNLTRAGDSVIQTLLQATDARLSELQGPFEDQWDFVARTRRFFPQVDDFGTHSGQLFEELKAENLNTPDAIAQHLLGEDAGARAERLLEEFEAYLADGDGIVRLDRDSSDPLLTLFLDKYAERVLERHPGGRGQGRPPRIASAARRFLEMRAHGRG